MAIFFGAAQVWLLYFFGMKSSWLSGFIGIAIESDRLHPRANIAAGE